LKTSVSPFLALLLLALVALNPIACKRQGSTKTFNDGEDGRQRAGARIVFKGRVLALAPAPGIVSGDIAVYQLAKYHVDHVCMGFLSSDEVVVDYLILNGDELASTKVGDTVCVIATGSNKILARWNAPGIREETESVDTYYIGEPPYRNSDSRCECS